MGVTGPILAVDPSGSVVHAPGEGVHALIERFPAYRLRAEDWEDIGRTRGVRRHPMIAGLKRLWAHVRWRPWT